MKERSQSKIHVSRCHVGLSKMLSTFEVKNIPFRYLVTASAALSDESDLNAWKLQRK